MSLCIYIEFAKSLNQLSVLLLFEVFSKITIHNLKVILVNTEYRYNTYLYRCCKYTMLVYEMKLNKN